jgi:hypothetical protein
MRTSPQGFGEFSREIPATHEKPVGIGSGRSARAPHTTAGMCAQMIRGPPQGEKDATHDEAENSRWMTTTWSGPWGLP